MRESCPTGLESAPDVSGASGPPDIKVIGGFGTLNNPLAFIEVLSKH
jgi:hypothetical protein